MNKMLGLHPSFRFARIVAMLIFSCVAPWQVSLAQAEVAAVLDQAGLKPGDKVADFLPGDGNFARMLCQAVGVDGHVYAIGLPGTINIAGGTCSNIMTITLKEKKYPAPELHSTDDDPGGVYEYWSTRPAAESFAAPEPLDVIFVNDQYPALHTQAFGSPNMGLVNKALLQALKPGGVLIITGKYGSEQVKQELLAVGFILKRESKLQQQRYSVDHFVLQFRRN